MPVQVARRRANSRRRSRLGRRQKRRRTVNFNDELARTFFAKPDNIFIMTAEELAILYLEQLRAYRQGAPPEPAEPNALYAWEDLIVNNPEQGWPVFEHALSRASDDDSLEQIWYR